MLHTYIYICVYASSCVHMQVYLFYVLVSLALARLYVNTNVYILFCL